MNAPLHQILRQHAAQTPEKVAIIWYGATITYRQLDSLSNACASLLHAKGVRQGDRVALFMQNCPQYIIAHFGIQKLGAIVCPCSPLFKKHELNYQLQDMGAKVLIAAGNLYPVVLESLQNTMVEHVMLTSYEDYLPSTPTYQVPNKDFCLSSAYPQNLDFLSLLERFEAVLPPSIDVQVDDIALLVYTSGTTGRPKGAMLTFGSVLYKTASATAVFQLSNDDIHLVIPPLYHISGMLCGIDFPIYLGGTLVLHFRFDPLAALESIESHKPTFWKGIAPMLTSMMDLSSTRKYDLTSLKLCPATSFGITTTEALAARWLAFSGNGTVFEAGYGLTETHTFDSVMPPDAIRWETNGRTLPGVECEIRSAVGENLPHGTSGEICLRSKGNFLGYWNDREKTDNTLIDGWVKTGDIGKLDQDGYLQLLGRQKELIKISGYSVFPEDVEAILRKHPDIEQIGIVGLPDPKKGQIIKAVIVLKEQARNVLAENIIAWSKDNMSAYKVPSIVEFREQLPMTASGKLMRHKLYNS